MLSAAAQSFNSVTKSAVFCGDCDTMLPSLSGITVAPPVASKKGGIKSAPIQLDGKAFTFILGSLQAPLRIPFSIVPFGGEETTRLTLNAEITNPEHQQFLEGLDTKVLQMLCDSGHIKKSIETIKAMYKPCFSENLPYKPLLRAKINMEEPAQVRTWNQNGELVDLPHDFKNMNVALELKKKGVWICSSKCGLTLDVTDIQICDQSHDTVDATCPFEVASMAMEE
jgi:hypothetical protein